MVEQTNAMPAADRSPWLTLWFWPQATIRRIAARPRLGPILLLSAVSGVYSFGGTLVEQGSDLAQLPAAGLVVLFAVVLPLLGILFVYLYAAFMVWPGWWLGGKAGFRDLRAVVAWSQAPFVVALLIALAGLAALNWDTTQLQPFAARPDIMALHAGLSLWSLFLIVRMTGAVQGFGILKSIVNAFFLLLLVLALLLFRTFAFQPFSIPSGSMEPTLLVGDYLFANKFAYGYGPYSGPFGLGPSRRVWAAEPARGDIAIFRMPGDTNVDFIKRIIGLPGDEVAIKGGILQINGQRVQRERVDGPLVGDAAKRSMTRYRETLPGGVSHDIFEVSDEDSLDNTAPVKVPPGHYFMLGDNRDRSVDSRMFTVGFIPNENLVGRAALIFYSHEKGEGGGTRWDRIFRMLR